MALSSLKYSSGILSGSESLEEGEIRDDAVSDRNTDSESCRNRSRHDSRRRAEHRSREKTSHRDSRYHYSPYERRRGHDGRSTHCKNKSIRQKQRNLRKDAKSHNPVRERFETMKIKTHRSADRRDGRVKPEDKNAEKLIPQKKISQVRELREKLRDGDRQGAWEKQIKQPRGPVAKVNFSPATPVLHGCRSLEQFNGFSQIGEGTFGVVYRAYDKGTNEAVALKHLKMKMATEGFPIQYLREIKSLLVAQHRNIVTLREIVVDSKVENFYLVMDYVDHDIEKLMKTMKRPFLVGEVKNLMLQLLEAVHYLHQECIFHRDLKPGNLLLTHDGVLKVADFGLARVFGPASKQYTPVVVTLWYRSPELLLGIKQYSTAIDMWSIGCIFSELLTMKPLFPGGIEIEQLNRIFMCLGTPFEGIWPGFNELPLVKDLTFPNYPRNNLRNSFGHNFSHQGFDLLMRFLTYNPARRITARDALTHGFFKETPKPVQLSVSPTKSEQVQRKA